MTHYYNPTKTEIERPSRETIRRAHGVPARPRAHSLAHLLTHFSFHPGTPCAAVHATLAHASTHASVPLIPHTVTHACAISALPKPPSRAINRSDAHTRSHANDASSASTTPRRVSPSGARAEKTAFVTSAAAAAPTGAATTATWTMSSRDVRTGFGSSSSFECARACE